MNRLEKQEERRTDRQTERVQRVLVEGSHDKRQRGLTTLEERRFNKCPHFYLYRYPVSPGVQTKGHGTKGHRQKATRQKATETKSHGTEGHRT